MSQNVTYFIGCGCRGKDASPTAHPRSGFSLPVVVLLLDGFDNHDVTKCHKMSHIYRM